MGLLFLVLFWKPVYNVIMYFVKKDDMYLDTVKTWFKNLWALIAP